MTSGKRPRRLCSVVSRAAKEDPAGCGTPFVSYLGMEVAPPWMEDVSESPRFPDGLRSRRQGSARGRDRQVHGPLPGPRVLPRGVRQDVVPAQATGSLRHLRKERICGAQERDCAASRGALADRSDGLSRFERYEEDTSCGRVLLVCTHSHDACCGKFGYPVYETLRHGYAGASEKQLRVWRTSHIGGHRFAPTLIDFPEGRYWGHLEPDALEKLVLRNGPVAELGRFYRGWAVERKVRADR